MDFINDMANISDSFQNNKHSVKCSITPTFTSPEKAVCSRILQLAAICCSL